MEWLTFTQQAVTVFIGSLPILGLVAFYLNIRKFGFKVEAYFSCNSTPLGFRVTYIILENKRDTNIYIEEIYLCSNNEIYISLKKFKTPLTLKPFELVSIEATQHSEYRIGDMEYEPPYFESTIVVSSRGKLRKCKQADYALERFSINVASTVDFTLDDKLYDKSTKYCIIYVEKGTKKTIFINNHGDVWGDWSSSMNRIYKDVTEISAKEFIEENVPWVDEYSIIEISFKGDNRVFDHVLKWKKIATKQLD